MIDFDKMTPKEIKDWKLKRARRKHKEKLNKSNLIRITITVPKEKASAFKLLAEKECKKV